MALELFLREGEEVIATEQTGKEVKIYLAKINELSIQLSITIDDIRVSTPINFGSYITLVDRDRNPLKIWAQQRKEGCDLCFAGNKDIWACDRRSVWKRKQTQVEKSMQSIHEDINDRLINKFTKAMGL